jgi:hypothetical protein
MLKSIGSPGLELVQSCVDPLYQTFLPRPTKGWPCKTMGPRPFARSSSLLVDPGDICPPQAPNLWVDFEIIDPKILGLACSFDFKMWMLWQYACQVVASELWSVSLCFRDQHFVFGCWRFIGCTGGAPNGCSPRALSGLLKIIHSKVFISCF